MQSSSGMPPRPPPASGSAATATADPLSSAAPTSGGSAQAAQRRHLPDHERITRILQSMGVNHFEPKVVSVLREFLYFYSADVLERATTVSRYAEKAGIDPEDIRVAIKLKIAHNKEFSHRPDRATLEKWAEHKNACPMPNIPNRAGIPLPQERFCLNAANYQVLTADPRQEKNEKQAAAAAAAAAAVPPPKKGRGRYGARNSKLKLKIVLRGFKRP